MRNNLSKNDKLIIIGASGHGRVVANVAMKMNKWESIAFLDDDQNIHTSLGIKVIGRSDEFIHYIDENDFFVAIGNNAIRERIQSQLEKLGASIPVLLDPSAILGEDVTIDIGTVVMPGVVINCNSKIGKGCIINTGATIDHDNQIGDYVHLSPGVHLAGTVQIGKGSWLGIGSVVSNNLTITGGCIIGAGAVVVRDIVEPGTYIGVPAQKTTKNNVQ